MWKPPPGRAGWFSSDNYGDSITFVDGHQKNDKKMKRVMKVIDDLDASEWLAIVDAARDVMLRRQAAPGKRSKSGGKGSTAAGMDGDAEHSDASDDSEIMLKADA